MAIPNSDSLARLRTILLSVPAQLNAISAEAASSSSAVGKWSPKQELGHLVDSACNNHQRIARGQLDERPAMPGYDGDRWVILHSYQQRDWSELIERWRQANLQLLWAAEAAGDQGLLRTCTIAGSEPLTLGFILADYVDHMLHHLRHIGAHIDEAWLKAKATDAH